jgi:hypothetical protein
MKFEPRPALEATLYMALLVGLAVLINLLPCGSCVPVNDLLRDAAVLEVRETCFLT